MVLKHCKVFTGYTITFLLLFKILTLNSKLLIVGTVQARTQGDRGFNPPPLDPKPFFCVCGLLVREVGDVYDGYPYSVFEKLTQNF